MTEKPKFIEYDGLKFTRDEKTGYYLNSTLRIRLHVYVWRKERGKIPKGYHIHHINGDKADNRIENLMLMSAGEHLSYHGKNMSEERKEKMRKTLAEYVRPFASKWHGSEAGKAWHREQYQTIKDKLNEKKEKVCDNCGKVFYNISRTRFCCNACKSAWRRKTGVDDVERNCEMCGKPFKVGKYSKQRFCSHECACKHHSIINEEKRKAGIPVNRPKIE